MGRGRSRCLCDGTSQRANRAGRVGRLSPEPRLTLAIPFYQGLDYLREAVESVRAQSAAGWQCLVCDDGGREAGVDEWLRALGDDRIRYQRNEHNLGMVRNWNRCIDGAEGDLVTLLHADDRLLPEYVEIVLGLAERNPNAAALFCDAEIIDAAGQPCFSFADGIKRFFVPRGEQDVVLHGEEALRTIMAGNFIMCPTLCLRKSVLGSRRFADRWKQVQDLDFTSGLLMDGDTLVGSRRRGYAYRRHPGNATALQSESLLRFREEFALFSQVAERAKERGWLRAARVSKRAGIVRLHLCYRALRDLLGLRFGPALRKLRLLSSPNAEAPHGPA